MNDHDPVTCPICSIYCPICDQRSGKHAAWCKDVKAADQLRDTLFTARHLAQMVEAELGVDEHDSGRVFIQQAINNARLYSAELPADVDPE